MRLDEVQKAMRVRFGPYSQEYHQFVSSIWRVEEALGILIRLMEQRGIQLELNVTSEYWKRLKQDPQKREE